MLDELPLSTKLTVAREWFRRSQAGEFPLTGGTADRFGELLEQCRDEAAKLQISLATIVWGGDAAPKEIAEVRAVLEKQLSQGLDWLDWGAVQ